MTRLNQSSRKPRLENLETRKLMAADLMQAEAVAPARSNDVDYFMADSFSFGVEREMKESGEKGGTADINIGVGELQECTISKSMDMASTKLAQFAINGNSPGTAEIDFVETAGEAPEGEPSSYLRYELSDCFVKSWSTSGDADDRPTEEVAFYYNKIPFEYAVDEVFAADEAGSTAARGKAEATWKVEKGVR